MRKYSTKKSKKEKRDAVNKMMLSNTFRIGLIIAVIAFGILYIVETSSLSTRGYEISKLKSEIRELEQENRKLDVRIAKHRSIKSITRRMEDSEFVPASNVEYVRPVGTAVARK